MVNGFSVNPLFAGIHFGGRVFIARHSRQVYIKESVDRHTTTLERIENIARANVTQAQLAQHEKESEEKYVKRTEIEGVMNFWSLVTSNLAKLFAIALVGLAIYATNNLIQQNKAITELQEEVQTQVRRK